ncbi:protein C19orf12-like [Oppia nitens]|uniref:protein C19orf12-like n=1 Tax=Oppia nitens TaxID=1686743 RepID=UPI0023DC3F5C|nr:protein C19orf12-like [Oppia nitens]
MTIDTNTIIKVIIDVMGDYEVQVSVRQSLKGAVITGVSSFIGATLVGPVGLAIGGTAGGLLAAFIANGSFKPIGQILNEMPSEKKRQLAEDIECLFKSLEINDLTQFIKIALICKTLSESNSQTILVHKFIEQSLPIIQKHVL